MLLVHKSVVIWGSALGKIETNELKIAISVLFDG